MSMAKQLEADDGRGQEDSDGSSNLVEQFRGVQIPEIQVEVECMLTDCKLQGRCIWKKNDKWKKNFSRPFSWSDSASGGALEAAMGQEACMADPLVALLVAKPPNPGPQPSSHTSLALVRKMLQLKGEENTGARRAAEMCVCNIVLICMIYNVAC